jgi:lipoate-protein ligase A
MEEWRLLDVETPNRAAMNLAIEEAIFLEKIEKKVPPTVRFWRNRCAAIVGYSQNPKAEVNFEVCRERKVQVFRRFSGGGAVYHDLGNLNYSIAIEADHPLLKGLDIRDSYELFSSGVIEGLKEFEIVAVFDPPSDLVVGKKKISGNAQSRKKGTVFHHETLLVNADLDLLFQVLNAPEEELENRKVASRKRPVTNLVEEIGHPVGMEKVKEALHRGFEKAFSVKLMRGSLTPEEKKAAHRLYKEKYLKKRWNFCQ